MSSNSMNEAETAGLRECPFCCGKNIGGPYDGDRKVHYGLTYFACLSASCGATVYGLNESNARARWNTRPALSVAPAPVSGEVVGIDPIIQAAMVRQNESMRTSAVTDLTKCAQLLLDACYAADAAEELSIEIDGSYLDDLSVALRHPSLYAHPAPAIQVSGEALGSVIGRANDYARRLRSGTAPNGRKPMLGPPKDTAVSQLLLDRLPTVSPAEADTIAVKIVNAIEALSEPPAVSGWREPTNEQVAALSKALREGAGITTTAGVLTEAVRRVLNAKQGE